MVSVRRAARAAGLVAWPLEGPDATPMDGTCALAALPDGGVLVVLGRFGRRLRVARIHDHGHRVLPMRPSALARAARGARWTVLAPRLPLDAISCTLRPELAQRPWLRLLTLLALDRRDLGVVAIYAVVVGALSLATPVAIQALVNTVALGSVLQPLAVLSLLLLGVLGLQGVLSVFETYVVEILQRRIFVRVVEDFGRRLPLARADALDGHHAPELVHRFFDVVTVQKTLASLLLDGLALVLQTGVGMLLLAFYHPLLLAFDAVLVSLLAGVLLLGRGALATALAESEAKYRAAAWISDLARAAHLVRGDRARGRADAVTAGLCRDWLDARARHFRLLLRQIAGGVALQILALVALLGVGGWLVIVRQLTLGQLVAAEIVATAMAAGFAKLGKNLEKLYDLDVGVLKLGRVANLPVERAGGEPPADGGPMRLALRKVSLSRGGHPVLRDADLTVPAGARLRLAGPPGAGLSTVLELLAALRPPDAGSVRFDGLDVARADLGALRDGIALVRGSDPFLAGSLLDNLALAAPEPLREPDARALLRMVGLEAAVDGLPEGLDTPIQPSGAPLSASQARRLALARALAGRPRLLLLDGALDGLGLPETTFEAILRAVLGPGAPWTVALTTGDPRVAAHCDRRAFLRGGRLQEGGAS